MGTILNKLAEARQTRPDTRSVSERARANLNRLYRVDRQFASAPTVHDGREGMTPMQERLPSTAPPDPRRGRGLMGGIGAYLATRRSG